jgi:hypothetical protein
MPHILIFSALSSLRTAPNKTFSYERASIEDWFRRGNKTSPLNNAPLSSYRLIENHDMRSRAREWLRLHGAAEKPADAKRKESNHGSGSEAKRETEKYPGH